MILAIYCLGGLGKEILMLAKEINQVHRRWDEICYVDDISDKVRFKGLPVFNFENLQKQHSPGGCEFTVASGEPFFRKVLSEKIENANYRLCTLIHPDITISDDTVVEDGCILCKGSVITEDVYIGKGTLVNLLCSIGHDANIGRYCTIQPHCSISGHVTIGDGTHIGTYSAIRDEVTIGSNCIIGMGSIVTKSIKANTIAYGCPANVVKENNKKLVFQTCLPTTRREESR